MVPRLPKAIRNIVFKARKRSQRYHERKWLKQGHEKGWTSGTFYRNFAGEKFKVVRQPLAPCLKNSGRIETRVKIQVLKGEKGISQKSVFRVIMVDKAIEMYNINEKKDYDFPPKEELRGRNIIGMLEKEARDLGKMQFPGETFVVRVAPANGKLRKLYLKAGFREFDQRTHDLEKVIHLK